MNKYMVIYYAPSEAVAAMADATSEEMQKGMEPWMAWMEACGDGLVDVGTPLAGGKSVTASGSSDSDKNVTGYSILHRPRRSKPPKRC